MILTVAFIEISFCTADKISLEPRSAADILPSAILD